MKMEEKFKDSALSPKERAEDLLPRLTLREKVGQVNQKLYGFQSYTCNGEHVELADSFKEEVEKWGGLGVLYGLYRADPWANKDYTTGLTGVNAIRAYNLAQHYVLEHSRFGIPMLMSSECPHGHQALDGYLLPVNLGMGAAWNPKLVEEGFKVVGEQQKEMGVDFALVSMLDILRDPRWGRSEECYGEDPYLCGQNAAAAVKGCASAGLEVVAKHFCAQGETTGGVNASAARIGERELREIHLPAMKEAVKAGATGVMAAYNEIDGVPCHANEWLLKDVLREGLGFDGIVMADGVAIDRLDMLTGHDKAANAAYALNAGVDVSLWDDSFPHLEEAVERGLVSEETLDKAVLRVLELKFARGLFEHPYLEEKPLTEYNVPKTFPQSLEIARPAVNVGLSVSRVGGDAQTKAMKKAAGGIRLDLAQYREMEVFTQFSSDLDETTKRQLTYGQSLMRLLRQPQYHPMSQHDQVITLVSALHHVMQDVLLDDMGRFHTELIKYAEENMSDVCRRVDTTGQLSDSDREEILKVAKEFLEKYKAENPQNA